ncbi:SMI1/KNR4 family protein [Alienimonas sp. DA493]|uniref:SMI1/KNR4 family protein n=1 Tax=Alienimonas sp. DA493 TaxID=3373605 RepID=UPI0037547362
MTPAEFWADRPDESSPSLTDAGVALVERVLGVKLPAAYLDLLRYRNGGETRGWECSVEGEEGWDEFVGELFGVPSLTEDEAASIDTAALDENISTEIHGSVLVTPYMTREWQLPPRQVLLSGDGHTWLSLDYRESEDPAVVFLQDDGLEFAISELAGSFDEFLSRLRPARLED